MGRKKKIEKVNNDDNIQNKSNNIINKDNNNNLQDIESIKKLMSIDNNDIDDELLQIYREDHYKPTKNDIKKSVDEIKENLTNMLDKIDVVKPEDLFPEKDLLPTLNLDVEYHDYEKDIEMIKIEAKETLECLANLYLTEEQMKKKNIYNIIKDDAKALARLNFSIEQAQRALISCMKQLDMGVNDPLMYQSVAMFQKEMRDTIKQAYELQRKMKEFYKELKSELNEIDTGDNIKNDNAINNTFTIISDPKILNDIIDQYMKDPTLLENNNKND